MVPAARLELARLAAADFESSSGLSLGLGLRLVVSASRPLDGRIMPLVGRLFAETVWPNWADASDALWRADDLGVRLPKTQRSLAGALHLH